METKYVTKWQGIAAVLVAVFCTLTLVYVSTIKDVNHRRQACQKANKSREFDWTFVQSAIAVREATVHDATASATERAAAQTAVNSYKSARDQYVAAYADVRDLSGATPLTVDCNKLIPLPWPLS